MLFHFEAVSTLSTEDASHAKEFGRRFMEIVNASDIEPALSEAN